MIVVLVDGTSRGSAQRLWASTLSVDMAGLLPSRVGIGAHEDSRFSTTTLTLTEARAISRIIWTFFK